MMKAVAYTSEILAPNGGVIHRDAQMESIRRYAAGNSIEIVSWFTDEPGEENPMKRPGVRTLLSFTQPYDIVLCERVWALSRSMAVLGPFFKELDRRGAGFESAESLWDCVSQQCRRRFKSMPVMPGIAELTGEAGGLGRYRVAKPARLNFVHLVHHAYPSISQRL